jgi:hypothetical protein
VRANDFVTDRTTQVAGGGAADPVISEQGTVVAFVRDGRVFLHDGSTRPVSDPSAGAASEPSIGAGGAYVAYSTASGNVFLYSDVRQLNLLESLDANRQALIASGDPAVSSRGNEVFFVHDSQIYARYLGPR